jgi:hypothetical protein
MELVGVVYKIPDVAFDLGEAEGWVNLTNTLNEGC